MYMTIICPAHSTYGPHTVANSKSLANPVGFGDTKIYAIYFFCIPNWPNEQECKAAKCRAWNSRKFLFYFFVRCIFAFAFTAAQTRNILKHTRSTRNESAPEKAHTHTKMSERNVQRARLPTKNGATM